MAELPEVERLVTWAPRVGFRHPLMRSAAYYAAPATARRRAHEALAAASDPERDPDRRAWHLAAAAPGPDEQIAAELERSADRARRRGGWASGAVFLERAAELTPDRGCRAQRLLEAAETRLVAGEAAAARVLLERAAPNLDDPLARAKARRLEGLTMSAAGELPEAASVLLDAAQMIEPFDVQLARDTLLEAFLAAQLSGPSEAAMAEGRALSEATGYRAYLGLFAVAELDSLAWRGQEADARAFADQLLREFTEQGNRRAAHLAHAALTRLDLGLGNYQEALNGVRASFADRAVAELGPVEAVIEAGVRCGDRAAAIGALEAFTPLALASGTPLALGLLARGRALLADDDQAEAEYQQSVEHLRQSRTVPELARSRLLYGEWLVGQLGRPGRRPGARHGHARTGQHRGGAALGGGEGQGHGQRVTEGRVGEREVRTGRPQDLQPGVVRSGAAAARPVHDGQQGQLIERDGATACGRMPGGNPQPGFELAQAHHVQRGGQFFGCAGQPAQPGIGLALADRREFSVQRGLEPGHVDVGGDRGRHEPGRGLRRERIGQVRRHYHLQPLPPQPRGVPGVVHPSVDQRQDGPGGFQQHGTGRCEPDTLAPTVQQLRADDVLQAPQLLAQRRLRDEHALRRVREAAGLGDRHEVAQVPQLDILQRAAC